MPKNIRRVDYLPKLERLKRVAAYARVSSGKDAMLHSLSAQISHYSEYIQSHDGWQYAGVYADEALTGTKDDRDSFQRLLSDCRGGKIDLIITKSISRFARNTVTLLETVRELKVLEVDVFFEEQNIHSLSTEGELMLTILASYAQEESLSASENQKWRIKRNFEDGKPWNSTMLGYRNDHGQLVVVPDEAEIVKRIFAAYLSGKGSNLIMKELNAEGVLTRLGFRWRSTVITKILKNYAYTGNLLLQTKYRENHITKRTLVNNGELPKYHATGTHEAIIPLEEFMAVQEERMRRAEKYARTSSQKPVYPFTGLIVCGNCGKHYRRKTTVTGPVWICETYNSHGKSACASKQIPEGILTEITAGVLGTSCFDAGQLRERLASITAENGNRLIFAFTDGTAIERVWQDRSRAESWTEEMKAAARRKTLERRI